MKSKNLWLIVISVLILIFDIAMSFILDAYSLKIVKQDSYILYACAKCIVVFCFVAIIVVGFLKKDSSHYFIQYIATLLVQLIPLIIRYLSTSTNGFLISIIIFFVSLIIYSAIVLGLFVLSKSTMRVSKTLEGEKIPVKEDDSIEQR